MAARTGGKYPAAQVTEQDAELRPALRAGKRDLVVPVGIVLPSVRSTVWPFRRDAKAGTTVLAAERTAPEPAHVPSAICGATGAIDHH